MSDPMVVVQVPVVVQRTIRWGYGTNDLVVGTCERCGAIVSDVAKHESWHRAIREGEQ